VSTDHLLIEQAGQVLRLTINRPDKRNALSLGLLDDLGAALDAHTSNADLKCAIISAAGDRCFAAGGDLDELDALRSVAEAEAMSKRGRRALDSIRSFPLPVVAGLNGLALGGGAELALACDFRIAVPEAEIGFLQGQLNVTTAWGGGIDLLTTLGFRAGMDLLMTARRVPAGEALSLGLIDRISRADQSLDDCLSDFLEPYIKRSNAVLRGYKAIAASYRRSVHEQLSAIEQEHFVATWTHPEHWAAIERIRKG
jgi:enoyl-CoA hydratase